MSTGTPDPIVVRKMSYPLVVSQEVYDAAQEFGRTMEAFMAMSPDERAEVGAKRQAERMAARAAGHAEARRFLEWLRARLDVVERLATHSSHYCDCRDLGCEDDEVRDAARAAVTAHREIMDEHQPGDGHDADTFADAVVCSTCATGEDVEGDPYPCATLRALAKAYGWTGEAS